MNRADASSALHRQLNDLEFADLIRLAATSPELTYLFRHALIYDSAYQSMLRVDRRLVHRAAGETLEALYAEPQRRAALAPQLARHFEEAADDARALHYYTLAGDDALARFANLEALSAFTSALACAGRARVEDAVWEHLYSARGRALELDSQFGAALANYQAMAQQSQVSGHRHLALTASLAMIQLYTSATALFDPAQAERLAQAVLAEARALNDEPAEAKILWTQLNLYRFTRRYPAALECGERSLAIARRLGLASQEALALNDLIHVYTDLGHWPAAELAAAEAGRLWRDLGNTAMLADSLSTGAISYSFMGQFAHALELAGQAQELSLDIGNLWGQAYSLSAMGWAYWHTGQPARALESTEACIRAGQQAGYLTVLVYDRARLAYIYAELGDLDQARALVAEAAHATPVSNSAGVWTLAMVEIQLDLRSGDIAQAAARLDALGDPLQAPPHWEVGPLLHAQSQVALAQDDASRALQVTQAHVARLRALGLRADLPDALLGLAGALIKLGRLPEARAQLAEALGHAQATGAAMLEWPVLLALGHLEAAHGQPAAAEPHWAQARAIVRVIVERIPTPELRQSFLARPELQRLFEASNS